MAGASSYTLSPCPMTVFSLHVPTKAASCARHATHNTTRDQNNVIVQKRDEGRAVPWVWQAGGPSTCRRVRHSSTCPRTCFRRPTSIIRCRAAVRACHGQRLENREHRRRTRHTYAVLVPGALVFVAGAVDHGALALPSVIDPLSLVPVPLLRHQRPVPIALHSKNRIK